MVRGHEAGRESTISCARRSPLLDRLGAATSPRMRGTPGEGIGSDGPLTRRPASDPTAIRRLARRRAPARRRGRAVAGHPARVRATAAAVDRLRGRARSLHAMRRRVRPEAPGYAHPARRRRVLRRVPRRRPDVRRFGAHLAATARDPNDAAASGAGRRFRADAPHRRGSAGPRPGLPLSDLDDAARVRTPARDPVARLADRSLARRRRFSAGQRSRRQARSGSQTRNVDPTSGVLVTVTVPPSSSVQRCTRCSPSPTPSCLWVVEASP